MRFYRKVIIGVTYWAFQHLRVGSSFAVNIFLSTRTDPAFTVLSSFILNTFIWRKMGDRRRWTCSESQKTLVKTPLTLLTQNSEAFLNQESRKSLCIRYTFLLVCTFAYMCQWLLANELLIAQRWTDWQFSRFLLFGCRLKGSPYA